MGVGSNSEDKKPEPARDISAAQDKQDHPPTRGTPQMGSLGGKNDSESRLSPIPPSGSRPQSTSNPSMRSSGSSAFFDDIKHEVMVNYLYQQQCSHLWVSDGSGEVEGVLLRKFRGHYMTCPSQLGGSPFSVACAALNVQVKSP